MIAIFRKLFHLPLLVLSVLELPFSSVCSVDVQMSLYSSSYRQFFRFFFLPFLLLVGGMYGQQAFCSQRDGTSTYIHSEPTVFSNSQLFSVEIIPLHLRICFFKGK